MGLWYASRVCEWGAGWLARGATGRGECGRGGGGTAASARLGLLHFLIDGEESAQGSVDGWRIGEDVEQIGVKQDYVRPVLDETIVILTAHGFTEIKMPRLKWIGFDAGLTSDF